MRWERDFRSWGNCPDGRRVVAEVDAGARGGHGEAPQKPCAHELGDVRLVQGPAQLSRASPRPCGLVDLLALADTILSLAAMTFFEMRLASASGVFGRAACRERPRPGVLA